MSEAVLRFRTDGAADARKLIDDLARAVVDAQRLIERGAKASQERAARSAKASNDATVRSAQAAGAQVVRETVASENRRGGAYRSTRVVIEREEKLVTRAKLRELALQGEAQKKFVALYADHLKRATAAFEAEVGKRVTLTEREQRQIESVALAGVVAHEQSERRKTHATERESARRAREDRQRRGESSRRAEFVGRAAGQVLGGAGQIGSQAHDMVQDARERRALVQNNVIEAVSQVGVSDLGEVNRYTDMAINAGRQHGLRSQDMTAAIGQAQTEFSTLGGMEGASTPEARAAVFQRAIDTAVRGRNMGVDPGEFSRLMGMLGQRGLDQGNQEFLSAWVVGAAQRGAVEPGSITREAMAPIIQRMSAATSSLGAGATPEQRQLAARTAFMQAFAEVQVMRSMGEGVRTAAGNMSNFGRVLTNPGVQTRMQTNIAHIADRNLRQRVQTTLFDRQGHLNQGLENPVRFVAAVMGAGMTDPSQIANVFAGSGAGNAMSLTAPIRRMALALSSRDVEGKSGVDRVNALQQSAVALSPERLAAMAALREGSDQANLIRNEEARLAALTTNNEQLRRLSDQLAAFQARNPLTSAALPVAATVAAGVLGAKGVAVTAGALGMDAQSRAVRDGRTIFGEQLTMGQRVGRGLGTFFGGPLVGAALTARDAYSAAQGPRGLDALLDALPERLARTLRENPPQVTLPPNATVHAGLTGAGGQPAPGS